MLRPRNEGYNARRVAPPLDTAALERLALRYVERFATTRGKLAAYLARKLRERGCEGDPPDTHAIAQRMLALGYVDDRAFAEARGRVMTRRGLGERRVMMDWRAAGIDEADAAALAPAVAERAGEAALAFARRKRIGPYATAPADRELRRKQAAAMIRAGHAPAVAWRIVAAAPGATIDCAD